MYNLYNGNSGSVRRIDERKNSLSQNAPKSEQRPLSPMYRVQDRAPPAKANPLSKIAELIPNTLADFETEDILLMLILYLMYRESGDSELLIIMGAMFLF